MSRDVAFLADIYTTHYLRLEYINSHGIFIAFSSSLVVVKFNYQGGDEIRGESGIHLKNVHNKFL
jgi:hypothetical protein